MPGLRQDKPESPETPREQAARFIQTLFESPDEPRIHAMLGLKTETGRKGEKRLQQKLVTLTFEGNTRKSYGQHVDDVPVLAHSHSMYTPTILYICTHVWCMPTGLYMEDAKTSFMSVKSFIKMSDIDIVHAARVIPVNGEHALSA